MLMVLTSGCLESRSTVGTQRLIGVPLRGKFGYPTGMAGQARPRVVPRIELQITDRS
jgi:hypothetical protein